MNPEKISGSYQRSKKVQFDLMGIIHFNFLVTIYYSKSSVPRLYVNEDPGSKEVLKSP